MTDNSNVGTLMVRAAILRNIALIITITSSFIILPMIINLLGDNWYGIWVIVGTFMGYFGIIDFGLTSATTRFLALHWKKKNIDEIGKTINTSFIGFCFLSIIVIILCFIAIWLVPVFVEDMTLVPDLRLVIFILAIDMAMTFPAAVYQSVLVVEMRNDITAILRMMQTVIRLGMVFLIVSIDGTIIHIALMTLGLNLLVRIATIIIANKYLPPKILRFKYFCKDTLKEYFHFGKFTFLGQIGDMIRFRVDVMVIGGMIGSSFVVPYNIALVLLQASGAAISNVTSGTQPVFAKYYSDGRMDQIREKLMFLTRVNFAASIIISCSLLLIAPQFITVWVGPEYLNAYIPLVILCAISPLGIGQNSAIQIFYAMSKHRYYAYINIIEAAFNLALSLLLVSKYGIIGVALGTAIPFIISKSIFVPYYICKFTEISIKEYLFNIIKISSLILILEAGCWMIINYYQIESIWVVFPLAAIWQIFIGIFLLKFYASTEDFAYILNTVPVIGRIIGRQH